jgi:hypothetical protein|tara:strand:- start:140 stop:331 length:192 start_codon:yes stop_codon:yes gene_type:complete
VLDFLSCRNDFLAFFNVDLRVIIIGDKIKIVIRTTIENKEKSNKANDVLMFQNNNVILTSFVF